MTFHADLSEISKLPNEQINQLLESNLDELLDGLITQSDSVKSLQSERDILIASVKSLAEFNLSRQHDFQTDRSKLLSVVVDTNHTRDCIVTKVAKLKDLAELTSIRSTLSVLLEASSRAEKDSDMIAQHYLDGAINHESFSSQYLEKRMVAYLRRSKVDKLRQADLEEPIRM